MLASIHFRTLHLRIEYSLILWCFISNVFLFSIALPRISCVAGCSYGHFQSAPYGRHLIMADATSEESLEYLHRRSTLIVFLGKMHGVFGPFMISQCSIFENRFLCSRFG